MINLKQIHLIAFIALLLPMQAHAEPYATTITQLMASPTSQLHVASQFTHGPQRLLFYRILSEGGLLTDTYKSLCSTGTFTNPQVLLEKELPTLYRTIRRLIKPALLKKLPLFVFLVDKAPPQHAYLCHSENASSNKPLSLAIPVTRDELDRYHNEELVQLLAIKAIAVLAQKQISEISNIQRSTLIAGLILFISQQLSLVASIALFEKRYRIAGILAAANYASSFPSIFLLLHLGVKQMEKAFENIIKECSGTQLDKKRIGATLKTLNATAARNENTPLNSAVHYHSATNRIPSSSLTKALATQEKISTLSDEEYFRAYLLQGSPVESLMSTKKTKDDALKHPHKGSDTPTGIPAT